MIKKGVFGVMVAAITLSAGLTFAAEEMEKCKVVDKAGKGLIKEHMAEGGMNKAGDPSAEIMVPKGWCAKVNEAVMSGNWSAVPADVKAKLMM